MSVSIDAYRSVSVGTASPRHVIIKLYETAVRDLAEAEKALARGKDAAEPLNRAQAIVGGLMSALDFEAGDLAKQLLSLYLFVLDRIQGAVGTKQGGGLVEARTVLHTLQEAWEGTSAEQARQVGRPLEATPGLHLRG